jgi:hypothetical protein
VPGERLVVLEEGTMSGIRVHEKYGVRQVLRQPIRVRDGNHVVVDPIDDERGLMDALEVGEARAGRVLPFAERRDLCGDDVRTGCGVEILSSLGQPLDERAAGGLT